MDYIEADDLLFAVVKEEGGGMWPTAATTAFPQTYRAMFGLCAKTNALKTAMFDAVESDNPYAFKALFRCYCEHYLKFTYIWVRFLQETTDAVGQEYFSYCGAIEARDQLKSVVAAEALLDNEVVRDVRAAIDKVYPAAAGLSMNELEAASAKFRYREILRFLTGPGLVSQKTPFLARIIPVYAELSSFVHGGPWSDLDMYDYAGPEPLKECRRLASLVSLMCGGVVMMAAIAVSREYPQCKVFASKMKAALDQVKDSEV